MSRVGKKPVIIPSGVKAELKGETLTVTGPEGCFKHDLASQSPGNRDCDRNHH